MSKCSLELSQRLLEAEKAKLAEKEGMHILDAAVSSQVPLYLSGTDCVR